MWDLMLHIDSYDKSICQTVSLGHVPESKEKFYKNNLYRAFKGFVISRRTLSILGHLLSYVRSTVCGFPFLSYCAASLAMLVSGSKRIFKISFKGTCYKMLRTWDGITSVHLKNPHQYLRKLFSKLLPISSTDRGS